MYSQLISTFFNTHRRVSKDSKWRIIKCFDPICAHELILSYQLIFPGTIPVACKGLQTVIPGETNLPPTHLLPQKLQTFGKEDTMDELQDEDFWDLFVKLELFIVWIVLI